MASKDGEDKTASSTAARRNRAASPGAPANVASTGKSQPPEKSLGPAGIFDFVSSTDVETLRNHKFVTAGSTPVDKLMDPFWCALARRVPRHISPNMISVIGGACAVAASVSSVIATRFESRALYFVAPFLLFIYMTADAIDGKHARMTSQSTPLGAVVDHGIDAFIAFSTGIAVVNIVDTKLSTARIMLGYCLFHSAWFCAQWGELELGSLDQRGITEAEFITMFVFALPGLISLDIMDWLSPVLPVVGAVQLRFVVEIGVIVACGAASLAFAVKIIMAAAGRRLHVCLPLFHMCAHSLVSVLLSKTHVGQANILITFIVVGMNAAMLMTKIRLAATLHCKWPRIHIEMIPFFAVALAHIAGLDFALAQIAGLDCVTLHVTGVGVLFCLLVWQCISYAMLWRSTIGTICHVLDIPFLGEVPEKKEK